MLVECELSRLIINEVREHQIVMLRELEEPHREFPIVIGIYEAVAIDRHLKKYETPRPLTHDLVVGLLEDLDVRLERIIINDLRENTFFAQLEIHKDGEDEPVLVDSRPSDALAIAVRAGCRTFVDEKVFDKVGMGE